jgi:hypothetical protein
LLEYIKTPAWRFQDGTSRFAFAMQDFSSRNRYACCAEMMDDDPVGLSLFLSLDRALAGYLSHDDELSLTQVVFETRLLIDIRALK